MNSNADRSSASARAPLAILALELETLSAEIDEKTDVEARGSKIVHSLHGVNSMES